MSKLSDLQSVLLATAAQRDSGSLMPPPDSLADAGTRSMKAITALVKRGLAEERETIDTADVLRTDGDLRYGAYVTAAGLVAIGVEPSTPADEQGPSPAVQPQPTPARQTKAASVLALLQREDGATLPELIATTGWLPHTTRAALTGLRKKGHTLERSKRGEDTCYRVVNA